MSRRRFQEEANTEAEGMNSNFRYNKRQRRSDCAEVVETIERLMTKLSSHCSSSVERRLQDLMFFLTDNLRSYKREILRILADCVATRPMQSSAYATFVGLVNELDFEFGGECMRHLMSAFTKSLRQCQWQAARGLLLCLADLANTNVITVGSLLQLLNELLNVCEELNTPQARRDYYAYSVLSTLPLVGRELYEKKESALQTLLERLENYVKQRCSAHEMLLRVWPADTTQHDYLELLWQQVVRLRRSNWMQQLLHRPYLAFDDCLSEALQHNLPSLAVPRHEMNCVYPCPWVVFRLFDCDCPQQLSLPNALSIERHLVEAQIEETLLVRHLDRKACAEELLGYCAAKRTLAPELCVVEFILGQLLQLPKSQCLAINYGAILIELCKMHPARMPSVLAQATNVLFLRLDTMSVPCFDRLVNWLSHHLSNFRFEWPWMTWASATHVPLLQMRAMFLQQLLQKCMRLSYHQHVVQMMPCNFIHLLPAPPEPHFKYNNELLPGAPLAKQLFQVIRDKCTAEVVGGLLEAATELDDLVKIDALMQTLLYIGSKSFTHTLAFFTKFQPVLKLLATNEASQLAMIQAIYELWSHIEQRKVVLPEKLLRMQIVSAETIVAWIFSQQLREELTKMYPWELLHSTIRFTFQSQTKADNEADKNKESIKFKSLLVLIIREFVRVLTEHEPAKQSIQPDYWFEWVLGRLQEMLFTYWTDVKLFADVLHKLSIKSELCPRVPKLLQKYLAFVQQTLEIEP